MGWGLPNSAGNYLDLVSAILGCRLLPLALSEALTRDTKIKIKTIVQHYSSVARLSPLRQIPSAVWALGFVSLLMDVSSEIIHVAGEHFRD
jgi:hypothetical protein